MRVTTIRRVKRVGRKWVTVNERPYLVMYPPDIDKLAKMYSERWGNFAMPGSSEGVEELVSSLTKK